VLNRRRSGNGIAYPQPFQRHLKADLMYLIYTDAYATDRLWYLETEASRATLFDRTPPGSPWHSGLLLSVQRRDLRQGMGQHMHRLLAPKVRNLHNRSTDNRPPRTPDAALINRTPAHGHGGSGALL